MYTFLISILLLIAGYFVYGRFVERLIAPDDRPTPAVALADGVDYVVLPSWKIFMIQFLNIAGTGPIFGAIMGAKFGTSAYLWIVLGCIFAGATHDYLSGMLSVRNKGVGLPELIGKYLGANTKKVMLAFSVLLLVLVGAVFVYSPASILGSLCGGSAAEPMWIFIWCAIIFGYYFLATMMPVDKIIGRIYPLFAVAIIFMAVALMGGLLFKWPALPEITDGLQNLTPERGNLFPVLFVTIACGAISGFHATQSPLMARCMKHEKQGRPIFYGAMITEGIVALIWATLANYFFYGGGAEALGVSTSLEAPSIVKAISEGWLGTFGGLLALLGVVAAPITSGDTALRSARLIIAEALNIEQKSISKRMLVCIPVFLVTFGILWYSIADAKGFNVIWNYFGWANQTLSVFTFWAITVYLVRKRSHYFVTLIPALFMTCVSATYICIAKECLALPEGIAYSIGALAVLVAVFWFCLWLKRGKRLSTQI